MRLENFLTTLNAARVLFTAASSAAFFATVFATVSVTLFANIASTAHAQVAASAASASQGAATPVVQTDLDKQVLDIAAHLRCLVCQNQSIADSHAPLAIDLRGQIREQLQAGKTQAQINSYMADRYGSFVLYSPPVQSQTWLLWFGPFALLVGLAIYAWRLVKGRDQHIQAPAAAAKTAELDQVLK
jgi:cytochrome c-type biogenesis protein CcmH